MNVGILDIGGNTASVWYAVERIGHKAVIVSDTTRIDALIVPGQGRFDVAAVRLNEKIRQAIKEFRGTVIGICLGMQLMFDASDEGTGAGLGVFPGKCTVFNGNMHVGWSRCSDNNYYYFVHSYQIPFVSQPFATKTCQYGKDLFIAECKKNNFIGFQFHPEKSGKAGEEALRQCLLL